MVARIWWNSVVFSLFLSFTIIRLSFRWPTRDHCVNKNGSRHAHGEEFYEDCNQCHCECYDLEDIFNGNCMKGCTHAPCERKK